jgi:1-deoxy-D-xylulose-5-phosphate reductoisomerase
MSMTSPVSVSVVGSTGSVGTQTLDVIRSEPGRFRVDCIGAYRSVDLLVAQAEEFRPRVVAIGDESLVGH